ncbi:MAG: cache domain-containing protein [Thermoproteota archaeon]|nr:cache domain-containing protein [Thermoproteota archaeon]
MSAATIVGMLAILIPVALLTSITLSPFSSSSSSSLAELNQTDTEMILAYNNAVVGTLANELETKINKSGAILEITSKLQEVKSAPFASSISPELHGIPGDVDIPKRKVAQDILDTDKDFQVIFFLMPNGDIYLVEPYSQQQNLTGNNFAFRDYYKGAVESRNTYLSDVIISAALGRPQANIAVPMYSENNGTLVGLWAGGLNLTSLSESLQAVNLTNNEDRERIVIVDRLGQKIVDSSGQSILSNRTLDESFADLQSFSNAINGQSGTITEIINGTMMAVSYHPVKAFSNVWAVLFMQPYDNNDVMASDKTTLIQNDLVTQGE